MMAGARERLRNRADAGRRLADALQDRMKPSERVVVLALPRGGVPVGYEVARRFEASLDVFVARKIGAPGQPEHGIGAIAEGRDEIVVDEHAIEALHVSANELAGLVAAERQELERRVARYREGRPLPDVRGRDVVLVDDGLATGVTAEAALRSLREREPAALLLAVPACAPDTARRLRRVADEVVCVLEPAHFYAVGQWYERFEQTTDDEVLALLRDRRPSAMAAAGDRGSVAPNDRGGCEMSNVETGEITGTLDKDYNVIWFLESCLSNVLRLETYIADADRAGDTELAEFFRRAQGESRKGAEQAKKLLAARLGQA